MQTRLGADFSRVRVHTDAAARASAADLGARAYTSGPHVVIGDGGADHHTPSLTNSPTSSSRPGPAAGTDHGSGLKVSDPSDRDEKAAEVNAAQVVRGPVSQQRQRTPKPVSSAPRSTSHRRIRAAGPLRGCSRRPRRSPPSNRWSAAVR